MADLQYTLERLLNPTADFGGGPGATGDAAALAKLILGNGSAAVGDTRLFGNTAPDVLDVAATRARMGGYGYQPDAALAQAISEGRVNPAAVLDRPVEAPTQLQSSPVPGGEVVRRGPVPPSAAVNYVPAGSFAQPTKPELKTVLDNANAIANSLSGELASKKTLLANPYGPGSYDPSDPKDVERVKQQRDDAAKIDKASTFLKSGILDQLDPKSHSEVVRQVLESVGVVPSEATREYNKAKAKASGEIAGGKGVKAAVPTEVTSQIGKPGFEQALTDAVANGSISDPNLQLRLQQQHQTALAGNRASVQDSRLLSGLKSSSQTLQELKDAYLETPAAKTGKLSDTLKAALARNSSYSLLDQFADLPLGKLSPEERQFAAKYNVMLAGLREFAGDNKFSNEDAVRVLKAVGSPTSGPEQFPQQLDALIGNFNRRQKNILDDIAATGRDVSGLRANRGQAANGNGGPLDRATAQQFLQQAGGDKAKARELAKKAGYSF